MHAYYQLQQTNPSMAEALPVPPVVSAHPLPPISLSEHAPQFGIPAMLQSRLVPPTVPSSILLHVPQQHSTHYLTVASQFELPHSQAHHHHTSATVKSNEIRKHGDINGSRNATHMANRIQNKDSKYSGADNENIMDFIVHYDSVSRDSHLSDHGKRQYAHNLFRGEALRY